MTQVQNGLVIEILLGYGLPISCQTLANLSSMGEERRSDSTAFRASI